MKHSTIVSKSNNSTTSKVSIKNSIENKNNNSFKENENVINSNNRETLNLNSLEQKTIEIKETESNKDEKESNVSKENRIKKLLQKDECDSLNSNKLKEMDTKNSKIKSQTEGSNKHFSSLPLIQNNRIMSIRHKNCLHSGNQSFGNTRKLRKVEWFGPVTTGLSDKMFYVNHPKEIMPDNGNPNSHQYIKIIDNNISFNPYINPYVKMVNQAMMIKDRHVISFKSKNYYEKAYELSLLPKMAKYDSNNPIFLHMANPHDYRFYQVE